jgi:hypothetical protein
MRYVQCATVAVSVMSVCAILTHGLTAQVYRYIVCVRHANATYDDASAPVAGDGVVLRKRRTATLTKVRDLRAVVVSCVGLCACCVTLHMLGHVDATFARLNATAVTTVSVLA